MTMVVLVLMLALFLQESISYTLTFGRLSQSSPKATLDLIATSWQILRVGVMLVIIIAWVLQRKRALFRLIIFQNGLLTLGLTVNMLALLDTLIGFSTSGIKSLLIDVVFMAIVNILVFSIWYWVIDPPGVEETVRDNEPWDFLFPQRAGPIPFYDNWLPRYSDYLFVAFTTSFAFSPTDTMPLSRRAKLLMMLQAAVSIITLTGIAGSAINILAGTA